MPQCEFFNACPYPQNPKSEIAVDGETPKSRYCEGNSLNCALYMLASSLGIDAIPEDLNPTDKIAAYAAIAEQG